MQIKTIVIVFCAVASWAMCGMDRILAKKSKKKQPVLQSFIHDERAGRLFTIFPHELKGKIIDSATGPKNWWFLDKVFTHKDQVWGVCFSPSGNRLATGSSNGKVHVYNVASKKKIASFSHKEQVTSLCFSLSGERLISGSWDKNANIYDIKKRKQQGSLLHQGPVFSVAYCPSQSQFATASGAGEIYIFDPLTQKTIVGFDADSPVTSICYSPSGKLLAAASYDCKVRILDMITHEEVLSLTHPQEVWASCFSPCEKYLATGSADKKIRIIDLIKQKRIVTYTCGRFLCNWSPLFIRYCPSGNQLAVALGRDITGMSSGKMCIIDVATQQEVASFMHEDLVYSLCYAPSGKQLATGSWDKKARIFSKYENYTLEQLLLKRMLLDWLLIEKPNQHMSQASFLLADISKKNQISFTDIMNVWFSFPQNVRSAIWRTMLYKIQRHGK